MDVHLDPGSHLTAPSPTAPTGGSPAPPSDPASRDSGAEPAADRPDPPDRAALARTVTQLQDHVQAVHRELRFRVDEATGQTVVRVVDADTGRLIRQIPDQNVLDLAAFLDSISGLLLRERA
jgi:flagellar protein FlaG